jgi:hypothetical protein
MDDKRWVLRRCRRKDVGDCQLYDKLVNSITKLTPPTPYWRPIYIYIYIYIGLYKGGAGHTENGLVNGARGTGVDFEQTFVPCCLRSISRSWWAPSAEKKRYSTQRHPKAVNQDKAKR